MVHVIKYRPVDSETMTKSVLLGIFKIASQEVAIQLFRCKCLSVLLYCAEACNSFNANIDHLISLKTLFYEIANDY